MKKYVTVDKNSNGMGYRKISEIMTSSGDKMNHMTVKNIVTRGFLKIAENLSRSYDIKRSQKDLYKIAQSPEFQLSIVEVMNNKDEDIEENGR